MNIEFIDIEGDGLLDTVTTIWCACTENLASGKKRDFIFPRDREKFIRFASRVDRWIIHNGSGYDGPALSKIIPEVKDFFTNDKIIDTLVISRVTNYSRMTSHSLKNWGLMLGCYKGEWTDWSKFSVDMLNYCRQDVEVLKEIWKRLRKYCVGTQGEMWKDAFDLEKDVNSIMAEAQTTGFPFDKEKAKSLLADVIDDMTKLEAEFQTAWPPELKLQKSILYRIKDDGTLYKNVQDAVDSYPHSMIRCELRKEGTVRYLDCFDYEPFSPSSPKQRIDKLWDAGWKPYTKTKGHNKALKDKKTDPEKLANFKRYGWVCNEDNLATLPDTAPEAAHKLAMWLCLEGRRSSLTEWINAVGDDGCIHGNTMHIGAWTHRCSHSGPNTANISSPWPSDREPKTAVEIIKAKYDGEMRSCWTAGEGEYLVGTDADGIQLRVLAHYMKSESYRDAILKGKKEDGTDIHSVNKVALGSICKSRDNSKTFIYAWLLGAGAAKVAAILECNIPQAQTAVGSFLRSLPELKRVKDIEIPRDARRGYFIGLDGRRVVQTSEYLMLAGYLQAGEAVIMKKALVMWYKAAKAKNIPFKLCSFVHDEWQTRTDTEANAKLLGEIQRGALAEAGSLLGMFCPIAGSTQIGTNWRETH